MNERDLCMCLECDVVAECIKYPRSSGVVVHQNGPVQRHAFGNAQVVPPSLVISVTMGSFSLTSFSLSTSGNTRVYLASLPAGWFATASESGEMAAVASTLNGQHSQQSSLQVFGHPAWFSARIGAAGIASYVTGDAGGNVPAPSMRAGDRFYLQLFAHTGASFEAKPGALRPDSTEQIEIER